MFIFVSLCFVWAFFFNLTSLLFIYYGFQVYVFMVFLGVPVSLHVCVLPCFFFCWFSFSVFFYSGLLVFVFACFLKTEKAGVKLEKWGYRVSAKGWGRENSDQNILHEKIYFNFKREKTETQRKRERRDIYTHKDSPYPCKTN